MTDWKEYRLGDLLGKKGYIRGPFGSSLKRSEMKDTGIAVYEQQHAIYNSREFRYFIDDEKFQELARFQTLPNDLIISCSGTIGEISIINENDPKGIISQALLTLRPNTDLVESKFLFYFFKTREGHGQLLSASHGSVQANIAKREVVESIPLRIPPIGRQKEIMEILSSLDDKIELNNQINKNLEALAQVLFKQWFIDFEFPNENDQPYKSSGGEMVESELGMIPKGWEIKKVGEMGLYITDLVANGSFASIKENVKPNDDFGYALFVRNTDLKNDFKSQKIFVDEHAYNFLGKSKLFGGEIILPNVGDVGTVHMCPHYKVPMTLGNNCIMVRSEVMQNWLYTFFRTEVGFHALKRVVIGSVQEKLSKTNFKGIKVIVPSKRVLKLAEDVFRNIYDLQQHNKNENEQTETVRDAMLPKLIFGQLEG